MRRSANAALEAGEAGASVIPRPRQEAGRDAVDRPRRLRGGLQSHPPEEQRLDHQPDHPGPAATGSRATTTPPMPGPGAMMFTAERRLEHIERLRAGTLHSRHLHHADLRHGGDQHQEDDHQDGHMIRDCGVTPEIECIDHRRPGVRRGPDRRRRAGRPGRLFGGDGRQVRHPRHAGGHDLLPQQPAAGRGLAGLRGSAGTPAWRWRRSRSSWAATSAPASRTRPTSARARQASSNADMVVQAVELVERLGSPRPPRPAKPARGTRPAELIVTRTPFRARRRSPAGPWFHHLERKTNECT